MGSLIRRGAGRAARMGARGVERLMAMASAVPARASLPNLVALVCLRIPN